MTTTCDKPSLCLSDLDQFTGTEQWHRHPLMRSVFFTDGAKYVADIAGAYWLLDDIAFAQAKAKVAREEFQVWKLAVSANATATLICEDGNDHVVSRKTLSLTDFPAPGIELWFANGVIYLPSEH
jgi:hypothetical protein